VTRKRLTIGLIVVLLLFAAGAAAAVWLWQKRHPADVRGSATQEFETTEAPGTTRPEPEVEKEPWPTYGFDAQRSHFAPDFSHRPPYRKIWEIDGKSLLEFPPVVGYDHVYIATNRGLFFAIDAATGDIAWRKNFGRCTAASPQVGDGIVYQPLMDPAPCAEHNQTAAGFIVAMDAETGEELWRFKAGVVESSPLLVDGVLYFGSWDKKIYAVDVETHEAIWYATPAVAYGRVYIGNTDGKVYAFGAKSGRLLWATGTGSYVYSSAAVFDRTVYAGSYDGNFYAFDAATGDVRWKFSAGGPISGSPTVMGGLVYFSTLKGRTVALNAKSGKKVWAFGAGQYSPLVADRDRVYLVGVKRLYALEER
jgi:outer membrane protein assembly factor BamB